MAKFESENKALPFPVVGQGTFLYTRRYILDFTMVASPEHIKGDVMSYQGLKEYIALQVTPKEAKFTLKLSASAAVKVLKSVSSTADIDVGVESEKSQTYWYSYDRDGRTLKYGKGWTMEATTLMEYTEEDATVIAKFFNDMNPKFLYVIPTLELKGLIDLQPTISFHPNPFTSDYPPVVMDSSKVTLFDLDRARYMFSSSLPQGCQELYGNIKGVTLDGASDSVMKLTDAIRYSINTPKCCLYETLQSKSEEFGKKDINGTYLRVTLGPDMKTAPGIPYVLELWPSGHYSPVHEHGGSCAIIKVLFGRITIKIFNKLTNPPPENPKVIKMFDAKEGNVTWLSPSWYQTHQLLNRTDDFCATIQCYRYSATDRIHWPGFDYISSSGENDAPLEVFYPNSDFTFVELRMKVLAEYAWYLSGGEPGKRPKGDVEENPKETK